MSQWGSIESNGIMQKIVYLISEPRYIQRSNPLLQVSKKKIGLYISFQLFGVLSSVAISQTLAAIGKLQASLSAYTHRAMAPCCNLIRGQQA